MKRLVSATGDLIDRGLLQQMLNTITEHGGHYELRSFTPGQQSGDDSSVTIEADLPPDRGPSILDELLALGCTITEIDDPQPDAEFEPAPVDGAAPDNFYATTNHRTKVRMQQKWHTVVDQRMDCCIVNTDSGLICAKLRDLEAGQPVLVGHHGIEVEPDAHPEHKPSFCFMSSDVSSERNIPASVLQVSSLMRSIRERGGRIVVVAGPAVVHTGAAPALASLIRSGFIHAVLAGNALPVHDIEAALFNTSLGVDLETARPVERGHRNHLRAINTIRKVGSIRNAVAQKILTSGIFFECERTGIPYSLAGSIRDDGPLPETKMNLITAQDEYAQLLDGANLVLMVATLLHSVGVGNMLPSWVDIICVDINPSAVLKLVDRGSGQVQGIVTDVSLFLHKLATELTHE